MRKIFDTYGPFDVRRLIKDEKLRLGKYKNGWIKGQTYNMIIDNMMPDSKSCIYSGQVRRILDT